MSALNHVVTDCLVFRINKISFFQYFLLVQFYMQIYNAQNIRTKVHLCLWWMLVRWLNCVLASETFSTDPNSAEVTLVLSAQFWYNNSWQRRIEVNWFNPWTCIKKWIKLSRAIVCRDFLLKDNTRCQNSLECFVTNF